MSEPESRPRWQSGLAVCSMDILEIAARRGRGADLHEIAAQRGARLPAFGRITTGAQDLIICVRPERWLLLSAPASPASRAATWQEALVGIGTAVDLSSGLKALHLAGPDAREVLARICRLDLDPDLFPAGYAAATVMAQVSVILAARSTGMLLLTPSSTARYFHESLAGIAASFGLVQQSLLHFTRLYGDSFS